MPKRFYIYFLFFLFFLYGWWWQYNNISNSTQSILNIVQYIPQSFQESIDSISADLEQITTEVQNVISTPGPLRKKYQVDLVGQLTIEGIIAATNQQREIAGLSQLKTSDILNKAAANKAQDMLDKQYFDHVSPSGLGASDIVKAVGYKFLAVGENLALGDYTDDKDLVKAWMDSPGHRANILSKNFTEIGIGIIYGNYDGHTTWLAVQEFGKPTTACPEVSSGLKTQIQSKELEVSILADELEQRQIELVSSKPASSDSQEKIKVYNKLVELYNQRINIYDQLAAELKSLVDLYNFQVKAFNACLKE